MLKRALWLFTAGALVMGALFQTANAAAPAAKPAAKAAAAAVATEEEGGESGLDLTLRTKAAAMPVTTADGSEVTTPASHAYLMDYNTGTVLLSKAGDERMYPSSMTKMMTLYMVFDKLKQGTLSLDSQFTVSEKAWRIQGSKMFVPLGEQVPLEDLIRGIAIQSGNDACVVVAEGIAGSEAAFAGQMNDTAKKIGMTNTNFVDASGWPNAEHVTTAHDLAFLAGSLIRDFPEYYHYVSEREFTYHNIRQFNRNLLLANTALGVDGLKTGHTEAAGYGITLSARNQQGRRLVLVINGLGSEAERASEGERLLAWGFQNFDNKRLFAANSSVVKANVWMGAEKEIDLVPQADVILSLPKINQDKIKLSTTYNGPIAAPVVAGQEYGKLTITMPGGEVKEVPLVAAKQVEKLSFLARIPRILGL